MKGSIRKRGSTYTVLWSTTDPATGARRQHSKGGFKKKEASKPPQGDSAREYLNSILGGVSDGSWRPDKAMTVKELLEQHWLPAQKMRGLRPTTLDQYETVIDLWLVPYLGAVRVPALTAGDVQKVVEKLRTTKSPKRDGLSSRTLQLIVGVLKAACKWAVENGLLARNPIEGIRRPRVEREEMKIWTKDEAQSFIDATADERLAFAWTLFLTRHETRRSGGAAVGGHGLGRWPTPNHPYPRGGQREDRRLLPEDGRRPSHHPSR
jgi:integrase